MPRHIPENIREQIVRWSEDGKKAPEIAELAGCSVRTVYNILAIHRDYDTVSNPFARQAGRKRVLDTGDLDYLASLIEAKPKIFLDELQEQLSEVRDIDVSIATISRSLRQWEITNKTVSSSAIERNERLRATWQAAYGDIPAEYCVWLDEASVDNKSYHRQNGWSTIGCAAVSRTTFIRGRRYSVLPALTSEGIIALDIFEGAVNKERFLQFVNEQVAPRLNPYPGPWSVVILDNCAIHHDDDIRAIIEGECGV
ncbi:hypothetical protein D9619_007648 [Psilocybe cf. subviscida]|uniref:Tc1-like transposase DDE domain-containing protein n=1 Tax=Psilocybe cf. subviscida TaxID=2480587 RepID=A0A8H5ATV9_9AGAR|nr:hypothetical protein D9619_007648 [Psilocybe cf. subviscida]